MHHFRSLEAPRGAFPGLVPLGSEVEVYRLAPLGPQIPCKGAMSLYQPACCGQQAVDAAQTFELP